MTKTAHRFRTDIVDWKSRVIPVRLEEASPEQMEALQVTPSNMKVSDYLLTLAHDPQTLKHRSPLFNAVMYGKDGLSRTQRELGAIGASLINGCLYCMSVHANRFTALSKRPDVIEAIFRDGEKVVLDQDMQLILDFAIRLSESPVAVTSEDIERLRKAGMTKLEIYDLIQSVALFGWANRLMHSLGDPVSATDEQETASDTAA